MTVSTRRLPNSMAETSKKRPREGRLRVLMERSTMVLRSRPSLTQMIIMMAGLALQANLPATVTMIQS